MDLRRIVGQAWAVSGILVAALMALAGSGTLAYTYSPEPPGMRSGGDNLRLAFGDTLEFHRGMSNIAASDPVLNYPQPMATPTPLPAPAERLNYGGSVRRTFGSSTGPFLFTFQAQAGDQVTITMVAERSSQSLDPALVLLGPDGKPVARNDDSFDSDFGLTNARLVNFPIPVSGIYTIQAMHSSDKGGSFTLSLRGTRAKSSTPQIKYGGSSQGTISDKAPRALFQFQALQGDVISIVVQSLPASRLAPYVALLDPNGDKLADSDPTDTTARIARITRYAIQDDGTYTIAVSRVGEEQGTTMGAFRVTLTGESRGTAINYGDTLQGTIDNNQYEIRYVFEAAADDVVTITLRRTSGTLSATLSLLDPAGRTLAAGKSASDLGVGGVRIDKVRIPADGEYTLVVGRKSQAKGTTTGKFSLSLNVDAGNEGRKD
jgi:hypothetical protein